MKTDEQRNHCSSKGDIYPYDGASPLTGITLADPNPTVADFSDTGKSFDSFSIGNEILFQGRRYDKESNLYYYRARHYDPVMGRFLQNDPMGYHDSMNLYQAFNMNGVNYLDPMGELTILIHGTNAREAIWIQEDSPFGEDSKIEDLWKIKTAGNKHISELDELKGLESIGAKNKDKKERRFRWSGKNKIRARKAAGKKLAAYLNLIHEKYPDEEINVVAHSHGGNVVNEAVKHINFKLNRAVYLGVPNHFKTVNKQHPFDSSKFSSLINIWNKYDSVQVGWATDFPDGSSPFDLGKYGSAQKKIEGNKIQYDNVVDIEVEANVGSIESHTILHGIELAPYIGDYINKGVFPKNGIILKDDSNVGMSERMRKKKKKKIVIFN